MKDKSPDTPTQPMHPYRYEDVHRLSGIKGKTLQRYIAAGHIPKPFQMLPGPTGKRFHFTEHDLQVLAQIKYHNEQHRSVTSFQFEDDFKPIPYPVLNRKIIIPDHLKSEDSESENEF